MNMNSTNYKAWREEQQAKDKYAYCSFDAFKREFPEVKEYECYLLDPNTKLSHIEGEPLLVTDCLGEACSFVFNLFKNEGIESCVWQERGQSYREYYRKPTYHAKRAKNGQFAKA